MDEEVKNESGGEKKEESKEVKPKKKGKGKKALIIIVIVVVVIFGGGFAAYSVFHSNPAFCNFLCHTPMDPYVISYDDNISTVAAQADSGATLLVTQHKDQGLDCLSCHVPTFSEQVTMAMHWVSGNYTVPLNALTLVVQNPGDGQQSGVDFCLRPGCHDGVTSLDDLKALYAGKNVVRGYDYNWHNNHVSPLTGATDCSDCHKSHEQSVMICTQCHLADFQNTPGLLPDGWITYQDYTAQQKAASTATN